MKILAEKTKRTEQIKSGIQMMMTIFLKLVLSFASIKQKMGKGTCRTESGETNQGKRLGYLKNLKETCRDKVMEANISDELTTSLDNILNNVGITWNNKVKPLPKSNQN